MTRANTPEPDKSLRKEFFSPPFPVTTTVQVARLYRPELVIEVTAVVEIPRERFHRPVAG